jgi:small-conductance mechanosensitive channel
MNRPGLISVVSVFALLLLSPASLAQSRPEAQQKISEKSSPSGPHEGPAIEESYPPGQILIEGHSVATVYEPVAGLSPEERAASIKERILAIARSNASPDAVVLQSRNAWTEILLDNQIIMAVTEADAAATGKPREQVAFEDAERIRQSIRTYRKEHGWTLILRGFLKAIIASLVLCLTLWILQRVRILLRDRVQRWIYSNAQREKRLPWHAAIAYVGPICLGIGAVLRWVLVLGLIQAYLTVTLGFFSVTREISLSVSKWFFSQLASLARSSVDYLPNLLVLAVIILITNYAIRLLRLIFDGIARQEIKIRGFYPDWAEPTEKLVRILVMVLALIVGFPYLPGAKSPAFQGISIFLGVLLSLGSSSAVANAIAGVIVTYMRSFLIGDWVQIGETIGEVTEKNLLVTRIYTPKAELITIPNATVMSGSVKNYSVEARNKGVIFHTSVTIGYDAPWRTVHQLLLEAAVATKHVLREPAPFVLQSALDDFYVSYELNAYTDTPREMLNIFSELHQNIQDSFSEASVEICSPHFSALRDGNRIAIPKESLKPDYVAPAFQVVFKKEVQD